MKRAPPGTIPTVNPALQLNLLVGGDLVPCSLYEKVRKHSRLLACDGWGSLSIYLSLQKLS